MTNLTKVGVDENRLIKLTGHGNTNSIKFYLQLDQKFHLNLVTNLRKNSQNKEGVAS